MTIGIQYYRVIKTVAVLLLLFFSCLSVATAKCGKCGSGQQMLKATNNAFIKTVETYEIPDVRVITDDGSATTLTNVFNSDKTIMMNFIFTSCSSICPIMSGIFSQVNANLGDDKGNVLMVSISIDPEYDTPIRLQHYAEKFNAGSNWVFLTGDLAEIVAVQKAFNIYRGNKMNHNPVTFIREKNNSDWIRLEGFASANDLVSEYQKIKVR
jgi:protein SCO1/2